MRTEGRARRRLLQSTRGRHRSSGSIGSKPEGRRQRLLSVGAAADYLGVSGRRLNVLCLEVNCPSSRLVQPPAMTWKISMVTSAPKSEAHGVRCRYPHLWDRTLVAEATPEFDDRNWHSMDCTHGSYGERVYAYLAFACISSIHFARGTR